MNRNKPFRGMGASFSSKPHASEMLCSIAKRRNRTLRASRALHDNAIVTTQTNPLHAKASPSAMLSSSDRMSLSHSQVTGNQFPHPLSRL